MNSPLTTADRVRSMLDAGPVKFAALSTVERAEMVRLCRRNVATFVRFASGGHYVLQPLEVRATMLRQPMRRLEVVR